MSKQTAVEWLEKEVNGTFYVAQASEMAKRFNKIFEEAKVMEREQIEMAYKQGRFDEIDAMDDLAFKPIAERYYNETYKGAEQIEAALPSKDDAVNVGFRKTINADYNLRKVCKDSDDDLYYSGWMDCYDWLNQTYKGGEQ